MLRHIIDKKPKPVVELPTFEFPNRDINIFFLLSQNWIEQKFRMKKKLVECFQCFYSQLLDKTLHSVSPLQDRILASELSLISQFRFFYLLNFTLFLSHFLSLSAIWRLPSKISSDNLAQMLNLCRSHFYHLLQLKL
jgi:hypothetical protein